MSNLLPFPPYYMGPEEPKDRAPRVEYQGYMHRKECMLIMQPPIDPDMDTGDWQDFCTCPYKRKVKDA